MGCCGVPEFSTFLFLKKLTLRTLLTLEFWLAGPHSFYSHFYLCTLTHSPYLVSRIGAVVKVVDSHLCGWGSIPSKSCSFFIVSLNKGLSLCFMCSDQHVKYGMPFGCPLTSCLILDYHVKQHKRRHDNNDVLWEY